MRNTPFTKDATELDFSERKKLRAEKQAVKYGDLYKALHHVGDDPVKGEIEAVLAGLLGEDVFRTVLAVFNLSTGWKDERDDGDTAYGRARRAATATE